jgi:hypothetical protein
VRLGGIVGAKGWSINYTFGTGDPLPPGETVDIVLRTNIDAARRTVDLYEVWNGELVYEDVPVSSGEEAGASRAP